MKAARVVIGVALASVLGTGVGVAQDPADRVRELYASAAYEDALGAVGRIDDRAVAPAVEAYRAYCLLALGRMQEAADAADAVVKRDPGFRPDDSVASPRLTELFAGARQRVVPDLLKGLYAEGKAALDQKDRATAIARFEELLKTAGDPDLQTDGVVQELKLLGEGFLTLSRALPEPAAPVATPPPAPRPPVITPPKALSEVLPPWVPPDYLSNREFRGSIRVHITADGRVDHAEIVEPIHPVYDGVLLKASQTWTYQPGLANGVPVPSEKTVSVVLKPRS
jgi:hypothetical protein